MKTSILMVLSMILLCSNAIAANTYIIDNNTVYIDDSKVYLSSTPHTLSSSGWVYFNLTSKIYTGNIDACWGFNTSVSKPKKAEVYRPHWVNTTTNHEKTFYNPSFVVYAGDDLDYGNSYNTNYKYTITESVVNDNGTIYITSNAAFDSFDTDGTNYTVYWYTRHDNHYLWKDFSSSFNSVIYNYEGFNKWYYIKNVPIISNKKYTVRTWIDVPISTEKQFGKYYFAIKPSGETISQAINNGHFYNLDPWWNATWLHRKEIILTGNTSGAQTDYQLLLNVGFVTGMQAEFGDLRFCNETHQIDAWMESFYDSESAKIWVEFPTTPANGVTQTYYMYYGNAGAESDWDIAATFIDGWDFEDDVIGNVPAGWTEDAAHGSFRVVAGKAVRLTHASGDSLSSNYAAITTITSSNDRVIEYDCTPRNTGDYSYAPLIRDGAGHANDGILMALRSIYFAYQTSGGWSNLQVFTKDQKYAVKIHNIDLTNNQYDVDIDSVNRGTNIAFRAPETQLTHINLEGSGGEACLNDWDNIRIRKDTANPPTYVFDSESYYANSIHYNISSPYNHTIESDGTIIANRSLIVTDDINWTAAALTDDCHLIVTKYNLSDVIIANFTIYTSSLDWLTVTNLSTYMYYNLLFSNNGTFIEQQFTNSIDVVYFTTNLSVGSYIIEKCTTAQYYVDSIHYNTSSPYTHTIESDGTIASNRIIIVTDDINWTAAALTDDCHLIVTKYNLSDVIIANFTISTSSLNWLTVPDLIKYTHYNLLFSNGTLIEKQFTDSINVVYFTTNLTIGSYIIEKGESAHPFSSDASHFYDEMKSGLTNFRDDMSKYLVWAILFFAVGLAFTIFTKIKQTLIGGK